MRTFGTVMLVTLLSLPLACLAQGDPDAGEKVFRKCKSCHQVGPEAEDKSGPVLNGIVGAAAAASESFRYSDALVEAAAEGLVWDTDSLAAFLTKPGGFVKGTRMSFRGLRKQEDIANIIAYLAQF
jgi:cytochrome c